MSFNRNEFPPRGWTFFQRETKWNAPHPLVDSFDETVTRIRNHRLANLKFKLPTDRKVIAEELEQRTRARLDHLAGMGRSIEPVPGIQRSMTKGVPLKKPGCRTCSKKKK